MNYFLVFSLLGIRFRLQRRARASSKYGTNQKTARKALAIKLNHITTANEVVGPYSLTMLQHMKSLSNIKLNIKYLGTNESCHWNIFTGVIQPDRCQRMFCRLAFPKLPILVLWEIWICCTWPIAKFAIFWFSNRNERMPGQKGWQRHCRVSEFAAEIQQKKPQKTKE